MRGPYPKQRGFTLLELLIAITLLGFILVILFSGLRLASRSWDTGVERATQTNDMRLVENLIRRAIAQIHPVVWQQEAAEPRLSFTGAREAMVFTAPLPAQAGIGGIYLMSLEVGDTEEGKRLLLRRQPYRQDVQALEDRAETTVLAEGVTQVSFSYFGSENPDDPPRWVTEWQSPMRLPQLIRVSFSSDAAWPDIVAQVRNDIYTAVAFPFLGGTRFGGGTRPGEGARPSRPFGSLPTR
jgi:general secretion pathway protein J